MVLTLISKNINKLALTKRDSIIEAAGTLFTLHGYVNVNMEHIAKTAGVSKQTVYSHFKSKQNLFTAAIDCKCDELELALDKIKPNMNCRDYLSHACAHLATILTSSDSIEIFRVCITEAKHSEVGELFWHAGPEKVRAHLKSYLDEQNQLGILKIENTDYACSQLISMINGQAQFQALLNIPNSQSINDIQNYAQSCANVFYAAYSSEI